MTQRASVFDTTKGYSLQGDGPIRPPPWMIDNDKHTTAANNNIVDLTVDDDDDDDEKEEKQPTAFKRSRPAAASSSSSASSSPANKRARPTSSSSSSSSLAFRLYKLSTPPAQSASITPGDIQLSELLYGSVQHVYVFNYMVDMAFLYNTMTMMNHPSSVPVTVFAQHVHDDNDMVLKRLRPHWRVYLPYRPLQFTCHHTKMMLIVYATGIRVVIHTNNMIEPDWQLKSQGVWTQDFPKQTTTAPATVSSRFQADLLHYLSTYTKQRECANYDFIFLRQYDFRAARVVLIPSIPLSKDATPTTRARYGCKKLAKFLEAETMDPKVFGASDNIVLQASSIGTLTKKLLLDELGAAMMHSYNHLPPGRLRMVWPTAQTVFQSYEGLNGGSSLCTPRKPLRTLNDGFLFKNQLFNEWNGTCTGRMRALPHIKTYCRVSTTLHPGRLAWCLLTSANVSSYAWRQHYEMGVLFLPSMYDGDSEASQHSLFSCTTQPSFQPPLLTGADEKAIFVTTTAGMTTSSNGDGKTHTIVMPLPHDVVMLTPYSGSGGGGEGRGVDDIPWEQ